MSISWVHGNGTVVETPENLSQVGHFGWGSDNYSIPGRATWLHIPLAPPREGGVVALETVYLLYAAFGGRIEQVDLWDGASRIQVFPALGWTDEHRYSIDGANTLRLTHPHRVRFGISLSFWFIADIGFDSDIPDPEIAIASAGAEYATILEREIERPIDVEVVRFAH